MYLVFQLAMFFPEHIIIPEHSPTKNLEKIANQNCLHGSLQH